MEHLCNSCGEQFNEPEFIGEDYELAVCPFCHSEDWDVAEED